MKTLIAERLGIQQRVFPAYRAPFFDLLAQACSSGLSVFAGEALPGEALGAAGELHWAKFTAATNTHLGSGRMYACVQRNLTAWLEEWQPEVLITEANPRYLSTPGAVRWMHARERAVIGWGLGAPPVRGFWRKMLRERFLSGFDALITYSQTGASQYIEAGFPPGRVFVAPNAAVSRPVAGFDARPDEFAGTGHRATILFVGRLQERKRVDVLLKACAQLPENLRPHVVVVGDGPVRPDLEQLAESIYPQAEFTGAKHGSDLDPYFKAADLFVLPGTGGLAVQQAMAAGLPVMVAEADGTQADLVREKNGWLLPAGDEQALTERLAEALSDPAKLRRMGRESYRIVDEEINLEHMVEVFALAVESIKKA
jgi:glycosyltransferase involved in cell wall biosynthesis